MRENGVHSLFVECRDCHHAAAVNMDAQPGHLTVPSFANRMRCQCGSKNVDVRPNGTEKPWIAKPYLSGRLFAALGGADNAFGPGVSVRWYSRLRGNRIDHLNCN